MALVKVGDVVRVGLLQKVTRFVSPPNPGGTSSFLWKQDSFSRQRRDILLSRMTEYGSAFYTSTTVRAVPRTEPEGTILENDEGGEGTNSGTGGKEVLDRTYGKEQGDPHKVAEDTQAHFHDTKDSEDNESLENTSFDISKKTRPEGGE